MAELRVSLSCFSLAFIFLNLIFWKFLVLLTVPREPSLQRAIDLHRKMQAGYMNSYQTAGIVGLSSNVFNRITGSVLIISGQKRQISDGTPKSNIGLQVKFPKNVCIVYLNHK